MISEKIMLEFLTHDLLEWCIVTDKKRQKV